MVYSFTLMVLDAKVNQSGKHMRVVCEWTTYERIENSTIFISGAICPVV